MSLRRLTVSLMAFLWIPLLIQGAVPGDAPPAVEFFSPAGTVKSIRQVAVRFSAPMVALGDPRQADPFDIQCEATGQGHWADTRNWVYDFDQDLPAGLRCSFRLKVGLRALSGLAVSGSAPYAFDTGGPAILRSLPEEGAGDVDEEQAFLLKLDAPATVQSVQQRARCAVAGLGEEIPVEVVSGATREAILNLRRSLGYQYFRLLWKDGEMADIRVRDREMERAEGSLLVLRCARRLPPASQVTLLWGRGIQAPSGLATSSEQRLEFKVRPAFVARVQCSRSNAQAGCLPMLPVEVAFSAPVPKSLALGLRLKLRNGRTMAPAAPTEAGGDTLDSVTFKAPFPALQTVQVLLPNGLVDDAGRTLENAARFPLVVKIDDYPPLARFAADFGILEAGEGGVLPVTLRNVESTVPAQQVALPAKLLRVDSDPAAIARWLRRVQAAGEWKGEREPIPAAEKSSADAAQPRLGTDEEEADSDAGDGLRWRNDTGATSVFGAADASRSFTVAKPAGRKAFEVVGIPLKAPGFYVVELKSQLLGAALLGRAAPRYVATAALVTDLSVHFKWGRESSLAWVTRLHDATPVASAQLVVLNACSGRELWRGMTDADGLAAIPRSLGTPHSGSGCADNDDRWAPLFVMAKTDADYAFTLTSWDKGIEPGEFGLDIGDEQSNRAWHTVLDRALLRAGETVSMKHFLRRRTMTGFALPAGLPGQRRIVIEHGGSGQKYLLTAAFDRDGIAESEWKIPAEARLGDYTVSIQDGQSDRQSANFKVQEFRLPSMRGTVSGGAAPLVNPKAVDLNLHVAYLSGGGAGGLGVKLRTLVQPRVLRFPGYPDYQFGGKPVTEGVVQNDTGAASVDFESDDAGDEPGVQGAPTSAQLVPLLLDANGSARATIPGIPALEGAARLSAELEYADANGELLTAVGHVDLAPAALVVGIHREGWAGSRQQLRFTVAVLDLNGAPQARRSVNIALYQAQRYSFRKRLIGGFYAYESSTETKQLAASCRGTTDAQGRLNCEVAPGATGEILIRAETTDDGGNVAGTTASMWVFDEEEAWFGGTSGDRMDLLPEKRSYEAGETARFQVRMPFREATALVTVERQGVMRSFVTHIDGRNPVVDVPITAADSPNVFVSVLAIRGRVAQAEQPTGAAARREEVTALVDLNKPAFRLGMAAIKVGWKPHQLDVRVTTDRSSYRVRDRASVKIHVARAAAGAQPARLEVAVAAVDAALLDLAPNPSWNLLAGMMGESGLEVYSSTAQMQVVGKRHFGRKAVPSGGGGGRDLNRELFDTLLLWKGRVTLDADGNGQVDVPLNDSLSEFRIVAIASGGNGFFGTGSATVHTTQDLMLLSGLPPQVREGDAYLATFTVRNTTDHAITADLGGARSGGAAALPLQSQRVQLPAGASRDVAWQVQAPVGAATLRWDIAVQQLGGGAADHLRVTQAVAPAFPVRTYQATLTQLGSAAFAVPVARPAGAIAGRGGIEVSLRPHLGDALDGVREYLRLYPYTCIEQRLSQAVVLGDRAGWDQWVQRLPAYQDRDGLLRYFPSDQLPGDDALTVYVLQLADESGWPIAEAARSAMISGLKRFALGQLVRGSALQTADLTVRKLAAIEALARYDAADRTLLESIAIDPDLWPTSALVDYVGILQRLQDLPDAGRRQLAALQILRARLNFQGTLMGFSTERSDALWWLMISADSNANRLLLAVMDRPEWQEDLPRLVRGALARQKSGHWNTTVANAWGTLALQKFSARFESTPVTGTTTVRYGATGQSVVWAEGAAPRPLQLPWSATPASVDVSHAGTGRPWVMMRATAALPLVKPLSSGFAIRRTVTAVEQKVTGRYSRGDVLRVHLDLEAQSDMSWVVVDDPVPSGASILGSGLGGQSTQLTRGERRAGAVWPAFEERRFDGFRSYFRFVPKGTWTVEYTVRLNNPGTFVQPATRVEAMYAPEMLAETPNAAVTVER